jgi:hypothetical protein
VSAAAFVGLGTAMALAGPGASSTTQPRSNRASVDPFTASQGSDNGYDRGRDASNNNDDGGNWSAQPPSGFGNQNSSSGGSYAFGGNGSGANTATHGS